MSLKKRGPTGIDAAFCLFSLFFVLVAAPVQAMPNAKTLSTDYVENERNWYVGINPMAPFASCGSLTFKMFYPFFSNLEYGFAAAGGYFIDDDHAVELRISLGLPHHPGFSFLTGIDAGYRFYILDHLEIQHEGLYIGSNCRFMRLDYFHPDTSYTNLFFLAAVGYWLELGGAFIDLRISQPIFVVSGSSVAHTGAAIAWAFSPAKNISPILPLVGLTMGYRF